MKADAVSIVEAAYECESETSTWLKRLLEQAIQRLDRGFGGGAQIYEPHVAPERMLSAFSYAGEKVASALINMCIAHPAEFHRVNSYSFGVHTITNGMTAAEARSFAPFVEYLHPLGIRDVMGVLARDPSGHALVFNVPMPDLRRPSQRQSATWSRIAAHICAGARLRRTLLGMSKESWGEGADAILSPSGTVAHADLPAQNQGAREALRRGAKAIDRARSKARSNESEALDLWQGLVAGRWSLVEQFDSDGRRFLVARKNDPDVTDPRALTMRERQVLAYVAMGHPIKLIAYSLGLSPSSVSVTRKTAMRKLGLRCSSDIVRLFTAKPPERPQER